MTKTPAHTRAGSHALSQFVSAFGTVLRLKRLHPPQCTVDVKSDRRRLLRPPHQTITLCSSPSSILWLDPWAHRAFKSAVVSAGYPSPQNVSIPASAGYISATAIVRCRGRCLDKTKDNRVCNVKSRAMQIILVHTLGSDGLLNKDVSSSTGGNIVGSRFLLWRSVLQPQSQGHTRYKLALSSTRARAIHTQKYQLQAYPGSGESRVLNSSVAAFA